MSADIILDDWALPASIDVHRNNDKAYEVDREKLKRNIQQNCEVIQRMRCEKNMKRFYRKYEGKVGDGNRISF